MTLGIIAAMSEAHEVRDGNPRHRRAPGDNGLEEDVAGSVRTHPRGTTRLASAV